jgi:hypothetical protein
MIVMLFTINIKSLALLIIEIRGKIMAYVSISGEVKKIEEGCRGGYVVLYAFNDVMNYGHHIA